MTGSQGSRDDVDMEKDAAHGQTCTSTIATTASDADGEKQNAPAAAPTTPPSAAPPDGGYGWVCTVCVALINAHTWGLNSSYGVFLAHYLASNTFPGAGPLDFAFVGGLSISMATLVAPVATVTTRRFGTKATLFTGIVLETVSLIGASFAKEIWQLFLSQGVAFGVGMGFLFVGSVGITPQWFTTRRSLANGIASAGSGIGGLVYSLATGAMIRTIGLAWAFRTLGIVACVVNTICALLIRDRNAILNSSQHAFDAKLFRRIEYLLLCAFGFFSMLGYVVLIFSLANYANAIGLSASQGALVAAILNLGQGLGRPPIGYFSDALGRINMAALASLLEAVLTFALWIPASSFAVLLPFALLGGTVAGTFWATIGPLAAEVTGLRHVPSALNLIWLVIVLPTTFSEPIALEIVQGTGLYRGTQLFVGFMYLAAASCLFALRGWKIAELDAKARWKREGSGGFQHVAAAARKLGCGGDDENDEEERDQAARAAGRRGILTNCWKWRKV